MDKINQFCIIGVKMQGFKRFSESYETRMDILTYIAGGNGQGKSTIADAIAYAFCGTPFWGERSCDKLQNNDGKEMQVEVQFADENGEVHTLTRRRCGNDTTVILDTVPVRQIDLNNIFAEKDVFLSILNPLYFIEKIAEDGREFLQKLIPPVNEQDVLAQLSDSTKTLLENESLLDPEFYVKKKREALKEMEEDETYINGQIDLLKAQQREAAEKIDAVLERGKSIVARKNELEEKQFQGIDIEDLKKKQAKIAADLSDERRGKLLSKRAEVQNRQYESKFADDGAKLKAELAMVSKKYQGIVAKAKGIKIGDVCPTCHTTVSESNYAAIIAALKAEASRVCEQGKGLQTTYAELLELDKKSHEKFDEFKADDLKRIDAELAELGDGDVGEIALLEDRIKLGNLNTEEFAELEDLKKQADAYMVEVNALCETDKAPEKIKELEKSLTASTDRKKECLNLMHAAGEFAAKKAEMILGQLKMNHAAIKLFDVVKTTGEVKNVFRFTYDGKDYRWLSTSEKIKAGLEVSKLLQSLTGLTYPTYIDNAECITTKLEPINGQVILAYAKNCPLAVQTPKKQQEKIQEAA